MGSAAAVDALHLGICQLFLPSFPLLTELMCRPQMQVTSECFVPPRSTFGLNGLETFRQGDKEWSFPLCHGISFV
jgi:hypothetical protein